MVCSIGSGRMAAMARLLAAGSISHTIAEDVGNKKLAAQYNCWELQEADEANLLDEEDMHVFDLKPMTDPLNLVCCKACKKPVKASQYAVHAELCKSLSSAEEIVMELDGGSGHKKPRKERKKLSTAYANSPAVLGERERSETISGHDSATLSSHLDEQMPLTSCFPSGAKGNSLCQDEPVVDGSGNSPGKMDTSTVLMAPPTKRSKLIAADSLLISDHLKTATGVTKSLCISTQEAYTCGEYPNGSSTGTGEFRNESSAGTGEYPKGSSAGSRKACDQVAGCEMPRQVHDTYLLTKDFPAPLATKIFYSQRDQRLRSAITNLYRASTNEHWDELNNSEGLLGNAMLSQTSYNKNYSREQSEGQKEKSEAHVFSSVQIPNHILAQSLNMNLDKSGGCSSAMNVPDQFPLKNVVGPHRSPVEILRTNCLSNPYSFAGNSEKALDRMQLPKGSVPVT